MENEQREGNTKKRLKKLWKKAKHGEINSAESYLECLASGVRGSPSLTFSADPGRGQADFDLQSSEVRSLLLSLLYDQQDQTPRVFSLKNRQFVRKIVVVNFYECAALSSRETTLDLREAIPGEFGPSFNYTLRISKSATHVTPLVSKVMCCKGSKMDRFIGVSGRLGGAVEVGTKRLSEGNERMHGKEVSKKSKKSGSSNKQRDAGGTSLPHFDIAAEEEGGEGSGMTDNDTLSMRLQKARLLLPAAMMRLWMYPLPLSILNQEREPAHRLHLPESAPTSAPASKSACAADVGMVGVGVVPSRAEAESANICSVPAEACTWSHLTTTTTTTTIISDGERMQGEVNRFGIPVLTRAGVARAGFCCTVPADSPAYASLFHPPSATPGSHLGSISPKEKERDTDAEAKRWMIPLPVCSVDCEMCIASTGRHVLTRVSVTTPTGDCALDVMVSPEETITDYLTAYSGVTKESLTVADTATSTNSNGIMVVTTIQAQVAFLRLVSAETLLVGHSLESDLTALGVVHFNLIDSAYLFPHPKGFPWRSKLKTLAEDHLGLNIQVGSPPAVVPRTPGNNQGGVNPGNSSTGRQGHDPREDARAAMSLVLHRLHKEEERRRRESSHTDTHTSAASATSAGNDGPIPLASILSGTVTSHSSATTASALVDSGEPPFIHSCVCHDSSCDDPPPSTSSNIPSPSPGLSVKQAAYMCVGPTSELHMTATTPQAVARVSEYLSRQRERERKSASRSCGGSGDDREREREEAPFSFLLRCEPSPQRPGELCQCCGHHLSRSG